MYNIVMKTPEVLVVDDFLPDQDWNKLINQVQADRWQHTEVDDKYWHVTDGPNYKSKKRWYSEYPYNDNHDIWFEHFSKFLSECDEVKPYVASFEEFAMRTHAYPIGSKNPWHHDLGFTTYTYYMHKHWQINWDATLLVVPADSVNYIQRLQLDENTKHYDSYKEIMSPMEMFEQRKKFQSIIDYGLGIFVSPKPNRLILINKGVVHGITRVDADAGENIRLTITGMVKEVGQILE
jgi:hypothetical protein